MTKPTHTSCVQQSKVLQEWDLGWNEGPLFLLVLIPAKARVVAQETGPKSLLKQKWVSLGLGVKASGSRLQVVEQDEFTTIVRHSQISSSQVRGSRSGSTPSTDLLQEQLWQPRGGRKECRLFQSPS